MAAFVSYEEDHVLVTFPEGLIKGYDSFPLAVITRCGLRFELNQDGKRVVKLVFYGGMYSNRLVFTNTTPVEFAVPAVVDALKTKIPYPGSYVKGPNLDLRGLYEDDQVSLMKEAQKIGLQWAGYVFTNWFVCKEIFVTKQEGGLISAVIRYEFIPTKEVFEATFECSSSPQTNLLE